MDESHFQDEVVSVLKKFHVLVKEDLVELSKLAKYDTDAVHQLTAIKDSLPLCKRSAFIKMLNGFEAEEQVRGR